MQEFNNLLRQLNSRTLLSSEYSRADEAVRTFQTGNTVITEWNKFKECMARFRWHLDRHLLNMSSKMEFDPVYQWQRAVKLLIETYGRNGEKAAFEMVRTGHEGGLYAVLKEMATRQVVLYSRNKVSALVGSFWNGLSADEKIEAGKEYISRYRDILPYELTEGSGARILANLPTILEKHPEMMLRLRNRSR